MRVLLGAEDSTEALNSRGVVYYVGKEARNGKCGLLYPENGGDPSLVDPWGRPYWIVVSSTADGKVTAPDGSVVGGDVIAYSLGEDGVFDKKDPKT